VQAVAGNRMLGIRALILMQKSSFAIAAALFVGIVATSLVIMARFDGFTQQAWTFLALFSITILTESLGQALVQCLFARNFIHGAGVARITAVVVAAAFSYLLARAVGSHVFILSDLVSHAIVISLSLYWLKRSYRSA